MLYESTGTINRSGQKSLRSDSKISAGMQRTVIRLATGAVS
jgi:hypothetical protein